MSPLPVDNQQDLRKLIEDYDGISRHSLGLFWVPLIVVGSPDYVPTGVRTRETPPTALEALRMIQADQPVILRGEYSFDCLREKAALLTHHLTQRLRSTPLCWSSGETPVGRSSTE